MSDLTDDVRFDLLGSKLEHIMRSVGTVCVEVD